MMDKNGIQGAALASQSPSSQSLNGDVFYSHPAHVAVERLNAQLDTGLSSSEAQKRLADYGRNELPAGTKTPLWRLFLNQFNDFVVILLIVASGVSVLLGDLVEGLAIMAIVILNAVIGLIQEQRADAALEALKKMAAPDAQVLRDGARARVPAAELVPGDIVFLEAGNYVPADMRLVESYNLQINESALTGESEAVAKRADETIEAGAPIGDRVNTAFSSTLVTYGRGKGIVVSTGTHTEIGMIARMLNEIEAESTPLQKRLNQLGKTLSLVALLLCGLVFVVEVARNTDLGVLVGQGLGAYVTAYSRNLTEFFILAVSLAVAAVPEGLAAVVTINLALGMREMVKRNALIRRLTAVETLGSATTICTDKTGTLTQNAMNVVRVYVGGRTYRVTGEKYNPKGAFEEEGLEIGDSGLEIRDARLGIEHTPAPISNPQSPISNPQSPISPLSPLSELLRGALLANDATLEVSGESGREPTYRMVGDPTEGALVVAAAKAGLWRTAVEHTFPRVAEVPFDADRKMMTTVHEVRSQESREAVRSQESGVRSQETGDTRSGQPSALSTEHSALGTGHSALGTPLVVYTKGAPDLVLAHCTHYLTARGDVTPLTPAARAQLLAINTAMAADALRVLAVATRTLRPDQLPQADQASGTALAPQLERDLTFLGLLGMIDPPRPEVIPAIQTARQAGIRTVMITGDYSVTARAIAR
ncbi:MAG: HAD-IC family P-type ATPase, partial [Chloroflexi bacterium]|nr:HAD-IC family P-type ATPase [Chloroflexota bacterium]